MKLDLRVEITESKINKLIEPHLAGFMSKGVEFQWFILDFGGLGFIFDFGVSFCRDNFFCLLEKV